MTTADILKRFNVTDAQVAKCSRQVDNMTGEIYYTATSQSNGPDHEVHHDLNRRRLTCCCKAGLDGVTCWAMRASLAHAAIYKQAERERAAAALIPIGVTAPLNGNRPFSILR